MNRFHVWIPVMTEAMRFAAAELTRAGVSFADGPEDANVILYPVPTPPEPDTEPDGGQIRIGGHGSVPLDLDLLEDPRYMALNARITAEAALGILLQKLPVLLKDCPVLILGWGRIGKCLADILRRLGAPVTVFARKTADLALARALDYSVVSPQELPATVSGFRCIVNTVPATVLTAEAGIRPDCLLLDLASGVFLPGNRVISARGLPGSCKPEASGALIARQVLTFLKGVKLV